MAGADDIYKDFLTDFGSSLKEQILQASCDRELTKDTPAETFYEGQVFAYSKVISMIRTLAAASDVSLADTGLLDIDIHL